MRQYIAASLAILGWLLATSPSAAQQKEPIRIKDVRVGFSNTTEDFPKEGVWVPVVVIVEKIIAENFTGQLVVETNDSDEIGTSFTPKVVNLAQNENKASFLTYIKTGGSGSKIQVTIEGDLGKNSIRPMRFRYDEDLPNERRGRGLMQHQKLILALGNVKGIDPIEDSMTVPGAASGDTPSANVGAQMMGTGEKPWRVATLYVAEINLLPEHWFGYESVDAVVLSTGGQWSASMAQTLANDQTRREALYQWVQMGGHLIVAAGSNRSFVTNRTSFPLEPLLPAEIDPNKPFPKDTLTGVKQLVESRVSRDRRVRGDVRSFEAELTRMKPRGTAQPVTFERAEKVNSPSIVQWPFGLGKVTLVGFDIDQEPFAGWGSNKDFWTGLLNFRVQQTDPKSRPGIQYGGYPGQQAKDLAADLTERLEQFGDVQVIPFGWVALFIFIYILIVGPVDYLFLKKVVKRLEWTWITFPTVVLVVSLGAYFLAYYLKGDELRINKLDVVDIDLHPQTQQVYGSTWFTIFSPRLQHYNIGVTPTGIATQDESVNVSWMGRPGYGQRSLGGRGSGPSLFQRTYKYLNEARSLEGVPIQVWSMKTLTSRWKAPLPAKKAGEPPMLQYDLKAERGMVKGSIQSGLPTKLVNCRLVYGEYMWKLGTLEPGKKIELSEDAISLKTGLESKLGYTGVMNNVRSSSRYENRGYYYGEQGGGSTESNIHDLILRMMFFRKVGGSEQNDYVDYLDQSWRLEFDKEAIILGIIEDADGVSTTINQSNRVGCKLSPFEPDLRGTMKQSTLVRILLPVTGSGE